MYLGFTINLFITYFFSSSTQANTIWIGFWSVHKQSLDIFRTQADPERRLNLRHVFAKLNDDAIWRKIYFVKPNYPKKSYVLWCDLTANSRCECIQLQVRKIPSLKISKFSKSPRSESPLAPKFLYSKAWSRTFHQLITKKFRLIAWHCDLTENCLR